MYPISNVEHSSLLLQVGLPRAISDAIANTKFDTSCKILISPRRARFAFSKFCTNDCERLALRLFMQPLIMLSPMLSTCAQIFTRAEGTEFRFRHRSFLKPLRGEPAFQTGFQENYGPVTFDHEVVKDEGNLQFLLENHILL